MTGRQHDTKAFRGTHDRCSACVKHDGRIASSMEFSYNRLLGQSEQLSLLFII